MLTTQRSESLNALMHYFMNAQTRLYEFIEVFDRVTVSRLEAEAVADLRDKLGIHRPVTSTKFEEKAFSLLTTYAFKLFKEQLVLSLEYVVEGEYVSHHEHSDKKRTVNWDPETQTIQCSFLYFEFTNILCRHSLRALVHYNVIELSDEYFSRRWCKGAVEMSTPVEGRRISTSKADIWKRKFISKAKAVGECGASSPDLRAKLEADLDSMQQYAFGGVADSEDRSEALLQYLKRSVSPADLDTATLTNLIKASGSSTKKGNRKPNSSSNSSSHSGSGEAAETLLIALATSAVLTAGPETLFFLVTKSVSSGLVESR
ncbi:hypothetical protein R1sor_008891 [Riccia sorocarpa]|uniref:Protein FAR1-RELATED SEQUENCE n=1 Tax=Riccia sorocarpa TaxID=122646 RepID=A0ABD3H712_9MARC